MAEFKPFATAIAERFKKMSAGELFVTVDGHKLWEKYLASYPDGTNPIYKTKTEHDCACCAHFVRNIGPVVSINAAGKLESIWAVKGLESPYKEVAKALDEFVRSMPISGLFRKLPNETKFGAEQTKQLIEGNQVIRWNHFYGTVAARHVSPTPDKANGDYRTRAQVFARGLTELKPDDVQTVLELCTDKLVYRGLEFVPKIKEFKTAQEKYLALTGADREIFAWANADSFVARFRNEVIGTFVQNLSEGMPLETAVKSFEQKVAPTNYQRTTALITPTQIKNAMAVVAEKGLEPSLDRRMARISDVSVNNVRWVNGATKNLMKGGLTDLLMAEVKSTPAKVAGQAEEISIEDFLANVLPTASSLEVLVQNIHSSNFVCLTAPVHADAPLLFKWNNPFAWSYEGNITDSIKELVSKAGGNTNAKLRVSLAWYNYDDLDIHVMDPSGQEISFRNKCGRYGMLDVDMNAGGGNTRTPVENVSWASTVPDGEYKVSIHQFCKRESTAVGFSIELENNGRLEQFTYQRALRQSDMVHAVTMRIKGGKIDTLTVGDGLTGGSISKTVWGVETEKFVTVNTVMLSPNYWDGNAVGNQHTFFILDGCKNDQPARGIYNEFLNPELTEHRKVFEILGDKTKCQPTDDQLSGLGFSATRQDVVTARVVTAKFNKTFTIKF